uniref:NADH-ubiquinone oxidoreductase chain 4L n=1 Tax=Mirax sp. QL-2014 TaxID=1491721 RepID=A0A0U1WEG9_9HYME|nr:NADH dehydrogenase subunit 4L [Mirax sp. QL-2014]
MQLNYLMNLSILFFLISCFMFSLMFKHMLMTLINIEFMILSLSYFMYMMLNWLNLNLYFMAFFWTICVCESIIGLSILVFMIRKLGNDFMNSTSLIK